MTIRDIKTEIDIKQFLLLFSIISYCGINFFGQSNKSSISGHCFTYKQNSTTSTTNSGRILY